MLEASEDSSCSTEELRGGFAPDASEDKFCPAGELRVSFAGFTLIAVDMGVVPARAHHARFGMHSHSS